MPEKLRWLLWPVVIGLLSGILINTARQQTPTLSLPDAVARAAPSVANIYTTKRLRQSRNPLRQDSLFGRLFPQQREQRSETSLGSAVIVDRQGLLLTNYHVIRDADEILVLLHDGRQTLATVVGVDPDSDLAVLRVELMDLRAIDFGDPVSVRVGETVLAIGNPWGFGQTVTQGIISATNRHGLGLSAYEDFLQTDAAINPGNSGGALIDTQGRLLGINTAIYTPSGGSSGIGLAIPADMAMRIMSDILSFGRPMRGWLGIEARVNKQGHIIVTGLFAEGPAVTAGVRQGDRIVSINGAALTDANDGMRQMARTRPGEEVELGLQRQGKRATVTLAAAERPAVTPR